MDNNFRNIGHSRTTMDVGGRRYLYVVNSGLRFDAWVFTTPTATPTQATAPGRAWTSRNNKSPVLPPTGATLRGRGHAPRSDSWGESAHGRDPACRDCHGHAPVSQRPPPGLVGRKVSRHQRECRQTPQRQNAQRQPLAAPSSHRGSTRRRTHQGHVLVRALAPPCGQTRNQEGAGGPGAHDFRDRLPCPCRTRPVSRAGRQLLR